MFSISSSGSRQCKVLSIKIFPAEHKAILTYQELDNIITYDRNGKMNKITTVCNQHFCDLSDEVLTLLANSFHEGDIITLNSTNTFEKE